MTNFAHTHIRKVRAGERAYYADPQPGQIKATDWDGHAWFYEIGAEDFAAFCAWFAGTFDGSREIRVVGAYPQAAVEQLADDEDDLLLDGIDLENQADADRYERRLEAWRKGATAQDAAKL